MGVSEVERFPSWLNEIGKPQLRHQHPADHLPPKPAAAQLSPLPPPRSASAPSNSHLRASICASSIKQFRLARKHPRLAITPCRFDGEAERLEGRRAGPCGRAGRACGRGFLARSQGVFPCDRCSGPCARGRRPCGDVRPGRRTGFWACGCSARTWLRGGFRGRRPCRRPWPARNRRVRRS